MAEHGPGCQCLTCGNHDPNKFKPLETGADPLYECGYCGNWYAVTEDGNSFRFPNAREAMGASIYRSKVADLKERGLSTQNVKLTAEDFANPKYAAVAKMDALEKSDKGIELRQALSLELFDMQTEAKTSAAKEEKHF